MSSYMLTDAVQMANDNPETFEIPSIDEIKALKVGDIVKMCFNESERMWVIITKIDSIDKMTGELDNEPFDIDTLKVGDTINFSYRHIYSIYD